MQIDKQAHLLAGWAIAATLLPYMGILVFILVVVMAGAKELWDATSESGTYDDNDFFATVAGGVVACLLDITIQFIIK